MLPLVWRLCSACSNSHWQHTTGHVPHRQLPGCRRSGCLRPPLICAFCQPPGQHCKARAVQSQLHTTSLPMQSQHDCLCCCPLSGSMLMVLFSSVPHTSTICSAQQESQYTNLCTYQQTLFNCAQDPAHAGDVMLTCT